MVPWPDPADQASPPLALSCPLRCNTSGGRPGPQAFRPGRGEMEEKELPEEVQAIRRFVRQTWIMMIVLLVVVVPTVFVGCMTAGVILVEFLPHSMVPPALSCAASLW